VPVRKSYEGRGIKEKRMGMEALSYCKNARESSRKGVFVFNILILLNIIVRPVLCKKL
jgi:hypothetical protein